MLTLRVGQCVGLHMCVHTCTLYMHMKISCNYVPPKFDAMTCTVLKLFCSIRSVECIYTCACMCV